MIFKRRFTVLSQSHCHVWNVLHISERHAFLRSYFTTQRLKQEALQNASSGQLKLGVPSGMPTRRIHLSFVECTYSDLLS